uniref:Uncharacterized protein n=2 Tax=Alexandrium monilatum TaxID=311494 RepID=A0A7S4T137_9DINO
MDFKVESIGKTHLPKCCHLAVRVGDTLKQGCYEPDRCFSFPQMKGGEQNLKIDIYKHIGSCICCAEDAPRWSHDVNLMTVDPKYEGVKLRVKGQASGKEDLLSEGEIRAATVRGNAMSYLNKHNVEKKLSGGIKALVNAQPADPVDFLCKYLGENNAGGAAPGQQRTVKTLTVGGGDEAQGQRTVKTFTVGGDDEAQGQRTVKTFTLGGDEAAVGRARRTVKTFTVGGDEAGADGGGMEQRTVKTFTVGGDEAVAGAGGQAQRTVKTFTVGGDGQQVVSTKTFTTEGEESMTLIHQLQQEAYEIMWKLGLDGELLTLKDGMENGALYQQLRLKPAGCSAQHV